MRPFLRSISLALCACGSSGAAACGAGGVMAWERGAGKGREGAEGVDVDYAPNAFEFVFVEIEIK